MEDERERLRERIADIENHLERDVAPEWDDPLHLRESLRRQLDEARAQLHDLEQRIEPA